MLKLTNKTIVILFIVLALIFCLPILFSGNNFGIEDWDHQLAFLESARQSIVNYSQFPQWDPYHCAGMPLFGSPQSGIISITFLMVLIFGTIIGAKISIFLHFLIALSGMYLLLRYFKYSKLSSFTGSVVFSFSGAIASVLAVGMLPFLYATYIPFIFLFLTKVLEEKSNVLRNLFIGSSILALSYYGGYQIPIIVLPILTLYSILTAIKLKSWLVLLRGLAFFVCFTLIALPKLALNIELSSNYPRFTQNESSGYTPLTLVHFLTSPVQGIPNNYIFSIEAKMDENSIYIGIVAFILLILGLNSIDTRFKIILCVILLLIMGVSSLSLYPLLKELPFYDQFRYAQRFRFAMLIPISIAVAAGIERITKKYKFEAVLISIFILIDLLIFSSLNLFSNTFIVKPVSYPAVKGIAPQALISMDVNYSILKKVKSDQFYFTPWGTELPAVLNNKATIACYETIGYYNKSNVKPLSPLIDDKTGSIIKWTPNEIMIQTSSNEPININQNYHSGWYAYDMSGNQVKLLNNNGLIKILSGSKEMTVILKYQPYKALITDLFSKR